MDKDRKPKLGDLIEISRKVFQHWAIYVGDGYVIHVAPEHDNSGTSSVMPGKGGKVTVQKQKLQEVVLEDTYCINNLLDDLYEPRPIEDILQEAKRFVKKDFPYDVLSRNCEHFVTLLRYGKPQSKQVDEAKNIGFAAIGAAAVIFGILAAATLIKEDNQDQ